jgi:hypothetical protein
VSGPDTAGLTASAHIIIAAIAIVPGVLGLLARRHQRDQGRIIQEIRVIVNGERDQLLTENARLRDELARARKDAP